MKQSRNRTGVARLALVAVAVIVVGAGCASDEELTTAVMSRLEASPDIEAEQISVSVDNRIVTLSGTVGSIRERERAAAIVQSVSGVRGFTSNLEIVEGSDGER